MLRSGGRYLIDKQLHTARVLVVLDVLRRALPFPDSITTRKAAILSPVLWNERALSSWRQHRIMGASGDTFTIRQLATRTLASEGLKIGSKIITE